MGNGANLRGEAVIEPVGRLSCPICVFRTHLQLQSRHPCAAITGRQEYSARFPRQTVLSFPSCKKQLPIISAVLNLARPVLLWDGRDDPYHDPMKAFAAVNGLQFLSTHGDHIQMIKAYGRESAEGVRAFLDMV